MDLEYSFSEKNLRKTRTMPTPNPPIHKLNIFHPIGLGLLSSHLPTLPKLSILLRSNYIHFLAMIGVCFLFDIDICKHTLYIALENNEKLIRRERSLKLWYILVWWIFLLANPSAFLGQTLKIIRLLIYLRKVSNITFCNPLKCWLF